MRESIRSSRIEEIQTAALSLFSDKGYVSTSMDEIADKVNLTKPALYLYFKNKEDLFFSIIQNRISRLRDSLDHILLSGDTPASKLRGFIRFYLSFFFENREFFKIIYKLRSEIVGKDKKSMKKFSEKHKEFIKKLASIIAEGINDKTFRKEDSDFFAYSLIGILNQTFFNILGPAGKKTKISSEEFVSGYTDKIYNLFINGIRS